MDEELKKLLEDLAGGLKTVTETVQTLATAQTTIVDRLEKAEGDNKTLSDTLSTVNETIKGLGDGGSQGDGGDGGGAPESTDPTIKALQDQVKTLQQDVEAANQQSAQDREAKEAADKDVQRERVRAELRIEGEKAGMEGPARDEFVNNYADQFDIRDGNLRHVNGDQVVKSREDATKEMEFGEFAKGLREDKPFYWPPPKGADFNQDQQPAVNGQGDLGALDALEGDALFQALSRPAQQAA